MKKCTILPAILLILSAWGFAQSSSVVLKLTGDGLTDNTERIQHSIDSTSTAGGGTLVFKAGRYLSGPISLKSHITLILEEGATLIASDNFELYTKNNKIVHFIGGNNLENVTLTGRGTIDGNGQKWWDEFIKSNKKLNRPRLIYITKSNNLTIENLTLVNSPSFHLVPQDCKNITINNLRIKAPDSSPNTDGIDPSRSKNVTISKCIIDVGDDNIAIKAGRSADTLANSAKNITVTDCIFLHGHGMSIGSETASGVKNLTVNNCTFDSTENGIRIKSNITLGGPVENVSYRNIVMKNVKNPILISFAYKSNFNDKVNNDIPSVNGFTIENLVIRGSKNAGSMIGLENSYLKNITLNNIDIEAKTGLVIENASGVSVQNLKIKVESGEKILLKNVTGSGLDSEK